MLNSSGTKRHLCSNLGNLLPNLGNCKHGFKRDRKHSVENNVVDALGSFRCAFHSQYDFTFSPSGSSLFIHKRFTAIVNNDGLPLLKDT